MQNAPEPTNFFVTGGAGCIGSCMVDALLERGRVTVYDNFSSGRREFIQGHLASGSLKLCHADVGDIPTLTKAMDSHDFVFHFAANPDIARAVEDPSLDLREGTLLTFNVLEAMRLNGIRKIVFPSGSGVYGDVGALPVCEDHGPLLPISMYGASKLACEALISAYCHMFDMQAWIFRFANVVGGRQTHGVAYDLIRKLKEEPKRLAILGDGKQSKSYIHVSDVIDAVLHILDTCSEPINYYNIATDDYINVRDIASTVVAEMGLANVEFLFAGGTRGWKGDVPVVRFDLGKIHARGWHATLDSRQAIVRSIREMLGQE